MEIKKAMEILEEYVELDRSCRETMDYSSEFDKFCEEKCLAIEIALNEINRLQEWGYRLDGLVKKAIK